MIGMDGFGASAPLKDLYEEIRLHARKGGGGRQASRWQGRGSPHELAEAVQKDDSMPDTKPIRVPSSAQRSNPPRHGRNPPIPAPW